MGGVMDVCKETKWLCENAKTLEKFAGQWVSFTAHDGIVSTNLSFDRLKKIKPSAFVFHVPSKEELGSPLPVAKKK